MTKHKTGGGSAGSAAAGDAGEGGAGAKGKGRAPAPKANPSTVSDQNEIRMIWLETKLMKVLGGFPDTTAYGIGLSVLQTKPMYVCEKRIVLYTHLRASCLFL